MRLIDIFVCIPTCIVVGAMLGFAFSGSAGTVAGFIMGVSVTAFSLWAVYSK